MATGFQPYSSTHALALLGGCLLTAVAVLAGRADPRGLTLGRGRVSWIVFVVVFQGFTQVWTNLPARFDPTRTLPLHICDLVPWVGVVALWLRSERTQSVVFYWGFGLSVFAFLMPILSAGPGQLEFWLFWIGHSQILGTAAFVLVIDRFRPTLRSLGFAVVVTMAYGVGAFLVDLTLGADYGYMGRRSAAAALGPWPGRVVVLLVAQSLIFALISTPWWIGSKLAHGRAPDS